MQRPIAGAFGLGIFLILIAPITLIALIAAAGRARAFPVTLGGAGGLQITPGSNMPMSGMSAPPPGQSWQQFHELNVVGDVGLKESDLPAGAKMVRLHVDGRDVSMRLDTELSGAVLQFDPNASYTRDLYRAVLTKRIEVVGKQELRDRIMTCADKAQPLKVEGYVFDRVSPLLVVKSVSNP
ncbi:MAG TPA: hypothetical protein VNF29_10730 [Candidatus Binataceae bacterium]|nr:hypothetical protein [Candidatus Binataceae bacterium]